MSILNILSGTINLPFTINTLPNVSLNGVGLAVCKIIEFFSFGGYVAIGILIFSLILKIIPLPLDIYSRTATKKNNLKMEKMRPELEKLQKQYANNKELYSQKMMALYKKEGYSAFATCLPSILSIVFFIVVITAFNQYSSYCKIDTFNQMAYAYNESIIYNENVDIYYYEDFDESKIGQLEKIDKTKLNEYEDLSKLKFYSSLEGNFEDVNSEFYTKIIKNAQDAAARKYIEIEKKYSFLWVQNIWIEDLPWKKAFIDESNYTNGLFVYSKGCSSTTLEHPLNTVENYKLLTGSSLLDEYKNKPNGYLILVVLSIASMLLSQLLISKDQKTQMELQSVDGGNGQAAQTSKMMMWMMPIMFGIFAFIYTASFSLYLIISTLFSTASTFIINKIVENKFKKKMEQEEQEKFNKRYSHLKRDKK